LSLILKDEIERLKKEIPLEKLAIRLRRGVEALVTGRK
jgi:hypothetical protein